MTVKYKLWVEKGQYSRSSSKVGESETKWSWTQSVPGFEGNLVMVFFGLLSLSCESGSSRIFCAKAPCDTGPGKELILKCWKATCGLRATEQVMPASEVLQLLITNSGENKVCSLPSSPTSFFWNLLLHLAAPDLLRVAQQKLYLKMLWGWL